MFLLIEDNPNCGPDERVFSNSGQERHVTHVEATAPSREQRWWQVIGVDDNGVFIPAQAVRVEDSSDGTAWLVHGGAWGLRLRADENSEEWSLTNKNQWGLPFLVLDSSGVSIKFKPM